MNEFTITRDGAACRVVLGGDLTAVLIPKIQAALKSEIEAGALNLTFDLQKTVMLDSSGIGLLIAAFNSVTRKQGGMHVVNVSGEILQLLQSMRLVARLNVSGRATSQP